MATKFCFGEEEATNEHATNEHEEEVKMLFAEMDMLKGICLAYL